MQHRHAVEPRVVDALQQQRRTSVREHGALAARRDEHHDGARATTARRPNIDARGAEASNEAIPELVVADLTDEACGGSVRYREGSDVRRASSPMTEHARGHVGAFARWARQPHHDVFHEVADRAQHAGTLGRCSVGSTSVPAPIGLIANPASGRDIRRLVANASTSTLNDKVTAVRRALIGATQCGADRIVVLGDAPRIARRAAGPVELDHLVEELVAPRHHDVRDTIAAARAMGEVGCAVVIVLGGDGTNRAVALGWPSAPVIPISTGTNNAFPLTVEPTLAGAAAGMLATGAVGLDEVGTAAAVVHVDIEDEGTDLAVVDAVLLGGGLVGSMLLFEPERLAAAVVARARSGALGMCGLAGVLHPDDPAPVSIEFGPGRELAAPLAPGAFEMVSVSRAAKLGEGEVVEWVGPGVLAFDGERSRKLADGQRAWVRVDRDGPIVIDVLKALSLGAERGCFG